MSSLEDFISAPVGARARNKDGYWAIKTYGNKEPWHISSDSGDWSETITDRQMWEWNFYIIETDVNNKAPKTAREALDLAWELAHPVKEGQTVPKGTRLINRYESGIVVDCTVIDQIVGGLTIWADVRTLDPLPEPEPDWLDAPAVISKGRIWINKGGGEWRDEQNNWCHSTHLTEITPLYPRVSDE